jgi:hypothetical protein
MRAIVLVLVALAGCASLQPEESLTRPVAWKKSDGATVSQHELTVAQQYCTQQMKRQVATVPPSPTGIPNLNPAYRPGGESLSSSPPGGGVGSSVPAVESSTSPRLGDQNPGQLTIDDCFRSMGWRPVQ